MLQPFSYRYQHPAYRYDVVLDCAAETAEAAMASAVRFIRRENARLLRAGIRGGKRRQMQPCRPPKHPGEMRLRA